jgi:hypothetical protein
MQVSTLNAKNVSYIAKQFNDFDYIIFFIVVIERYNKYSKYEAQKHLKMFT